MTVKVSHSNGTEAPKPSKRKLDSAFAEISPRSVIEEYATPSSREYFAKAAAAITGQVRITYTYSYLGKPHTEVLSCPSGGKSFDPKDLSLVLIKSTTSTIPSELRLMYQDSPLKQDDGREIVIQGSLDRLPKLSIKEIKAGEEEGSTTNTAASQTTLRNLHAGPTLFVEPGTHKNELTKFFKQGKMYKISGYGEKPFSITIRYDHCTKDPKKGEIRIYEAGHQNSYFTINKETGGFEFQEIYSKTKKSSNESGSKSQPTIIKFPGIDKSHIAALKKGVPGRFPLVMQVQTAALGYIAALKNIDNKFKTDGQLSGFNTMALKTLSNNIDTSDSQPGMLFTITDEAKPFINNTATIFNCLDAIIRTGMEMKDLKNSNPDLVRDTVHASLAVPLVGIKRQAAQMLSSIEEITSLRDFAGKLKQRWNIQAKDLSA